MRWSPTSGNEARRAACAALVVGLAACGGSTTDTHSTQGNTGASRVALTPSPLLVAVGGSAQIAARVVDSVGGPVNGPTAVFQSSDPTVATVSANGVVNGVRAGATTIKASAGAASGATPATVVAATTITGHVFPIDGGSLAGLVAGVESGVGPNAQDFLSSLDGNGAFSLGAPLTFGATDSMKMVVDVASGTRRYHPTVFSGLTTRITFGALRPMLVPRTSVFSTPAYPSSSMDVSLVQAFQRVCTDDTNANCNSFFPQIWKSSVILWNDADLPVRLAFYTTATTSPISAADSTALWTIIGEMQNEVGRKLFVPATLSSLTPPDVNGFSSKAVLVWVDSTLAGFAGYTNWIWDGNLNMLAAKTRVTTNAALASRSLMKHELLHALGFHHTCAWTTIMGGYGCTSAQSVTKSDAAAFNLGYLTRRTILANQPTTTLGDALLGEQLRETGVVASRAPFAGPVPFAARGARQIIFGGRLVSSDGAP